MLILIGIEQQCSNFLKYIKTLVNNMHIYLVSFPTKTKVLYNQNMSE